MAGVSALNGTVQSHYGRIGLGDTVLAALREAGKDLHRLTVEDLAPVDAFHIRGRAATRELARAAGLDPTAHVLDVGGGIGGTARCLASEYGCPVTAIDLALEYCRAAAMLTARTGLDERITFSQADALALPFPDASFDVAWTEHVAMNIADKGRLYREMYRVLKPGGRLAIYDILAGPNTPVVLPAPWARTAESSFLVTPEELRCLLVDARFRISSWSDTTDVARAWFARLADNLGKSGPARLGIHVLMGPDFAAMAQNQRRNLDENRIALAQIVATK
ncbi:MAG: methyltransferase domain-containing protein [Rhodocyclaceae bacterium]